MKSGKYLCLHVFFISGGKYTHSVLQALDVTAYTPYKFTSVFLMVKGPASQETVF